VRLPVQHAVDRSLKPARLLPSGCVIMFRVSPRLCGVLLLTGSAVAMTLNAVDRLRYWTRDDLSATARSRRVVLCR
jgi:hypothetical protein